MNNKSSRDIFKKIFLILGILSAIGLLGYGLTYIIVMPAISPGGFVPTALNSSDGTSSQFGALLAAFILLYAFSFLPVSIMFTIKKYSVNPSAMVLAGCFLGLSTVLEIINNLPLLGRFLYPRNLEGISANILLYLRQEETLKYLSFDVAGFSLIYMVLFIYALVFFRTHRWLSYSIMASIALFIANVPCLWFAPNLAVVLMAISVLAIAPVPIFMAKMAVD